jgi:hypothetical protein
MMSVHTFIYRTNLTAVRVSHRYVSNVVSLSLSQLSYRYEYLQLTWHIHINVKYVYPIYIILHNVNVLA